MSQCDKSKHLGTGCPLGSTPASLVCASSCPLDKKQARKCVILNGPPGCGKDTISKLLLAHGFAQCENKESMHDIALAMSGIDRKRWFRRYNNREKKELPWDELNGMSIREFMIYISEVCVKTAFGNAQFGKLATRSALSKNSNVVFSDGGFQEEMGMLQEGFGADNVLLVQLFRAGHSFDGDSRNYLKPAGSPCLPLYLHEGDPDSAVACILDFIYKG